MGSRRIYHRFSYKDSNLRLCCRDVEAVATEIIRQRTLLEAYIVRQPEFKTSLVPLRLLDDAPEIAQRMAAAAERVGVGPMAAVAGAIAQYAVECAVKQGDHDAVAENGGDIFARISSPLRVALHAGAGNPFNCYAFHVEPADTPLAICSSSSRMGHSFSLGNCDLATVVSHDAALADAAATQAANWVSSPSDLTPTAQRLMEMEGVLGVLLIKDSRIALLGQLPELIRNHDDETERKITRDVNSRLRNN